jgi:hypothetical protein
LESFTSLTDCSGILYASTSLNGDKGRDLLDKATQALLSAVNTSPAPEILWSMQYQHRPSSGSDPLPTQSNSQVLRFPPPSMDLAFDDAVFDNVKEVWQKIVGEDGGEFLAFKDREVYDDDE